MARSTRPVILNIDQEYIYFMGSDALLSTCYILSDESSISFYSTSNGYKYFSDEKYLSSLELGILVWTRKVTSHIGEHKLGDIISNISYETLGLT